MEAGGAGLDMRMRQRLCSNHCFFPASFFLLVICAFSLTACTPFSQQKQAQPPRSHAGDSLASFNEVRTPPSQVESRDSSKTLEPPSVVGLATGTEKPPTPDQLNAQLQNGAHDWFYGKGFGRTILNVGAIVLFPPYAIYVLGNAGLQMAGVDPLYMSDALPSGARKGVNEAYDIVTSAPGKLNARVAGEEFCDK